MQKTLLCSCIGLLATLSLIGTETMPNNRFTTLRLVTETAFPLNSTTLTTRTKIKRVKAAVLLFQEVLLNPSSEEGTTIDAIWKTIGQTQAGLQMINQSQKKHSKHRKKNRRNTSSAPDLSSQQKPANTPAPQRTSVSQPNSPTGTDTFSFTPPSNFQEADPTTSGLPDTTQNDADEDDMVIISFNDGQEGNT